MPINSLPAQVCELQDSHVRLCPGHFPPELSLLTILVLILMRVPPPQCAEQSPLSQLLHSQFIGVSWIEYNVHNVSYNINLFLITTILNISTNSNTYEYNFRTTSCRNFWPVDFVTILRFDFYSPGSLIENSASSIFYFLQDVHRNKLSYNLLSDPSDTSLLRILFKDEQRKDL